MTNLFYALLFIISGSFNSETPSKPSNLNEVKLEHVQSKNTSSTDINGDDDDDGEDEDPNED